MTNARYRKNAGSVFSLKYHLVWCPKYRRKVLVGTVAEDLNRLLYEKAEQLEATIEAPLY
jgi:putative transposase